MAISDNWQKAAPSSTFGTPALDFYVIDLGQDVETDYDQSNSLFAKAIRGIQAVANLYMIGVPVGNAFTVAVVSGTCPGSNPGATYGVNTYLEDAINTAADVECSAYYAALSGNTIGFNWD